MDTLNEYDYAWWNLITGATIEVRDREGLGDTQICIDLGDKRVVDAMRAFVESGLPVRWTLDVGVKVPFNGPLEGT